MAPLEIDTVLAWRGKTVRDRHGEKIGRFGDVYLDRKTDLPAYAAVSTGLFGTKETYLRLDDARLVDDDVQVPYDRRNVLDAPQIDPNVALTAHEEALLDEHYGRANPTVSEHGEMIRSEEQVRVSTRPVTRRERVRLRKHVVTEDVQKTVPVRREEIRVEHDPPPDGRIVRVEDADNGS